MWYSIEVGISAYYNKLKYKLLNATTGSWSSITTIKSRHVGVGYLDLNFNPDIDVDSSGNVHVVWRDNPSYPSGDFDIYYMRLEKGSSSWTTERIVSDGATNSSTNPVIDVNSEDVVNIVWQDESEDYQGSGNDVDIFYRKLTLSTSSGGGGGGEVPGYDLIYLIGIVGIVSILLVKKYRT